MATVAFLILLAAIPVLALKLVRAVNKAAALRQQRIREEKAKYCPECGRLANPKNQCWKCMALPSRL